RDPEVQQRITSETDFARRRGLMDAILDQTAKSAVTDAALRAAYEEQKAAHKGEDEVRIRVIEFVFADPRSDTDVTAAEKRAKAAMERVKKGKDFAALAAELTENPV